MASDTTPIRIAQTLGITGSLVAAGMNLGLSIYVIPSIMESPAPLLLKQWTRMFDAGIKSVPPLAITSSAAFLWLAWNARQADRVLGQQGEKSAGLAGIGEGSKFGRYLAAGLVCVAMVPYTPVFLGETNRQLFQMAAEQAKSAGEVVVKGLTAHQLVDRWGMLNLPRAAMLFVGGVLGLWTVLE